MIDELKEHEGFRATMYSDAAGHPTIGYGTLIDSPEEQYLRTATITEAEGEALLRKQLATYEDAVTSSITVPMAQNQFDALVSLAYNIGPAAFRNSSLVRLINQRAAPEAISRKWREYRLAGGRVLPGLVIRRAKEVETYWSHLWRLAVLLLFCGGAAIAMAAITATT